MREDRASRLFLFKTSDFTNPFQLHHLRCCVASFLDCFGVISQPVKMEKMFGPAYTGDPGVPHSDKEAFSSIFWGSVAFSAYSIACPYYWEQCNNMFNWHDLAMVHENHHMRRALKKGKPYEFKWNKMMNKEQRDAYYHNWADYFP